MSRRNVKEDFGVVASGTVMWLQSKGFISLDKDSDGKSLAVSTIALKGIYPHDRKPAQNLCMIDSVYANTTRLGYQDCYRS